MHVPYLRTGLLFTTVLFLVGIQPDRGISFILAFSIAVGLMLIIIHQAAFGFLLDEWSTQRKDTTISTSMVINKGQSPPLQFFLCRHASTSFHLP